MAVLLFVALALVIGGMIGLQSWLEPREHALRFIVFWFVCAWITLTALLLALLDLLVIRAQARQARKALRPDVAERSDVNSTEQ